MKEMVWKFKKNRKPVGRRVASNSPRNRKQETRKDFAMIEMNYYTSRRRLREIATSCCNAMPSEVAIYREGRSLRGDFVKSRGCNIPLIGQTINRRSNSGLSSDLECYHVLNWIGFPALKSLISTIFFLASLFSSVHRI